MNLNEVFIKFLSEKFPNQFSIETKEEHTFIKFPAKNSDFGGVEIYEEQHGSYIVEIGKFTHHHIDGYFGAYDEVGKEAAEDVCCFLEKLFTDQIICHGSDGWGGFLHKESYYESYGMDNELYVWSGLYEGVKLSG